ncbi:MAG: hypothetical protein AAGU74_03345 [Bacillota bacterium]
MEKKAFDRLFGGLVRKMKTNRKVEIAVYVVLVALVILLYFATTAKAPENSPSNEQASISSNIETGAAEEKLEARLAETLSKIRGAGKVKVMITYETGTEIVPAMSVDKQVSSSESDQSSTTSETESTEPATVSKSGSNEPIVITEKQPTIRGVIVIAEGAADISVMVDLQRAVQTVLNIPASSIEVFEMTSKEE